MLDNLDVDDTSPSDIKKIIEEINARLATVSGDMQSEIDSTCLDGNCE